MNKIAEIWHKLSFLGIHDGLEDREVIKIKLINKLGVVGLLTTILLLIIVRVIIGYGSPYRNLGTMLIIFIGGYFHYARQYNVTRHILCLIYPTYIAFLLITGGRNMAQLNLLVLIAFMIFVLYDNQPRLKFFSLAYVFIIGIFSHMWTILIPSDMSGVESNSNHMSIFISTLLVLSFAIYFYQREVKESGQKNSALLKELKRKNSELEKFAYVTSHDLKEPIRNIGSLASVLEKSSMTQVDTKRDLEMINLIEVTSRRMSSLIDSILNFSKIDSEEFFSEEVDLNVVLKNIEDSHKQFLNTRNATLVLNDLPRVNGNAVFLSLLFQNLIRNGIEHNNSEHPVVKIKANKMFGTVKIKVEDNGIGIDSGMSKYIFEPFKKLNSNLVFQGSGLGLSICKKVVEYHGGTIDVSSGKNMGSIFNVSLPV